RPLARAQAAAGTRAHAAAGTRVHATAGYARSRRRRDALGHSPWAASGLDDHPAWALAQQVGRGRPDPSLAGGRADGRPVDDVRAHARGFFGERRPGVAGADQARVDLDSRASRLDARALEHRAALGLLLLEARLERQLAGHGQDEDRIHDPVLAYQL